ncbi:hypothetical protein FRB99_000782 [Tulasnella sp. 403]|nr:hypothetical protein FRB99_000782 [Tulasnella sp. 403]
MASTKQRNIKPADDDSDAFTEPDEEEETRPMPRRSKGKKRVSDIHGTMTVPLNDIQNAGDETESDDEERSFARQKLKARTSTIDLNDDTAEKRKRRKSAKQSVAFINPLDASEREAAKAARAEKGRASGANRETTPERPTNTGAGPRTPKVSALARANQLNAVAQTPVPAVPIDILTSKYEEWMKLATDNKINANNAWNFALIDYFQDMSLLRNELDNSINFQKASFTLDGCVKIWTSRVDSVGTETGKLLNNLADDIRAAQSDSEEQQDGEGEGKAKKQKVDGDDMLDYFDAAVMKNWAGPEHWKLRRPIKKADPSGEDAPAPRARKEKVAFQIDFHSAPLSSKELFAPATTSITLPAGTGATISGPSTARRKSKKNAAKRDQFLLPDDMHFSSAQLLRLFRKPTFMDQPDYTSLSDTPDDANVVVDLGCLLALVGEVGDGEIDERFWANAAAEHAEQQQQGEDGDETGPIPFNTQFFHDDYDDGDGPAFDEDYHEGQSALPRAEEEDFLAAAQGQLKRTRPEFVQYAKKAKRVDVRKLKQNIWKSLDIVTGRLEDEDEEDAPVPDRPPTDPTEARPFENVIGKLQSAYPREKMEEISTSFCFICLLHLANEQGLKLEVGGKEESAMAIDEEAESERRVGDLFGVKVYRDPNAVPSA